MRFFALAFFITFPVFAQQPKVSIYNHMEIIDSTTVYTDTYIGKVDARDAACFSEIENAKKDFGSGIFTYYNYVGHGNRTFRSMDIFQNEVEKLGMKYELAMVGCTGGTIITKSFIPRSECYKDCMSQLVNEYYGAGFFENLEEKCDSLYVIANIDKVFETEGVDTHLIRYKKSLGKDYNAQFSDVKKELSIIMVYTEDFKYKNEEYYSYTSCYFTIRKDGKISDLSLTSTFQNNYNYKFKKYFEEKLKQFVLDAEWIPATSHGIVVNSAWSVTFHYK